MTYDKDNIFAKIIRGEVRVHKVYEDEKVLAFHDISKAAPIHVLVTPKGEYQDFSAFVSLAEPSEISNFFKKINEIVTLLKVDKTGFRLILNTGPDANQTVSHFHTHILAAKNLGPLLSDDNLLR
jgi:diadenosine tetraphosphate (Ap4A) HIT family hydrolase